jgi:hypothetical protein
MSSLSNPAAARVSVVTRAVSPRLRTSPTGQASTAEPSRRSPSSPEVGDGVEQLMARIADWEASQHPAEQPEPTEEQVVSSAEATAHGSATGGERSVKT